MTNKMDRYISGLFLLYFLGGILVFITLFLSIDAMSLLVNYKGMGMSTLMRYEFYAIPELFYRMMPVGTLFGTIFSLSVLHRNNEIIALHSIGWSLFRISTPFFVWILLISVFTFVLSDQLLPNWVRQKNYIFFQEIKKNPNLYSMVKTNKIWFRSKDMLFYIKTLNEKTKKAQGLNLYYFDEHWNLVQMITAKEVDLMGVQWLLKNGSVTLFTKESSFPLTTQFRTKSIAMGEDAQSLSHTAHPSDVLSIEELSEFIYKNKEAGLDTVRYEVEYHSKFSYPLVGLVMSLLAIPFSVGRARSGGVMRNIGMGLGFVFLYWTFHSSSMTLGNYGHIPPIVAAWAPALLTSFLGGLMIIRKK